MVTTPQAQSSMIRKVNNTHPHIISIIKIETSTVEKTLAVTENTTQNKTGYQLNVQKSWTLTLRRKVLVASTRPICIPRNKTSPKRYGAIKTDQERMQVKLRFHLRHRRKKRKRRKSSRPSLTSCLAGLFPSTWIRELFTITLVTRRIQLRRRAMLLQPT